MALSVTIIIAARPGQAEIQALAGARGLDYDSSLLEILVARGTQPSVQRNAALREAQGDWVYFLDDDSVPDKDNLRRAAARFEDPQVQMVGGPNLCPPDAPPLERQFALTMSSWLAFGPSRARYRRVGIPRETGEKELILCNLLARRGALLELGGFDEALYPNEENALMDGLRARGGKLIYDPDLVVYRHPRRTLRSFIRMLINYGRGRAEQFRLHPTWGSALNFAPPLFCFYLMALPFLPWWCWWPMVLYALALIGQAMCLEQGRFPSATIPLMFLSHVFYGLGFWWGLFTRLHRGGLRPDVPVTLERVSVKQGAEQK
jgi:cellulose synthase/poly-beta-1,6-N-acetylglucosamine synthase-like glycosyltransferase